MKNDRGSTRRSWVKFWITGWLHGSIRWQLDPSERATWADLICLAGECNHDGMICDNDGRPFPVEYIANMLNIPMELLASTLAKCESEGRVEDGSNGVIVIANWGTYQSEYQRQKKYRKPLVIPKDNQTLDQYKQQLKIEFKDLNFDEEYKKFELWWSEGNKELKRPKTALRNWLLKARQYKEKTDGTHKQGFGKLPTEYTKPEELLQ